MNMFAHALAEMAGHLATGRRPARGLWGEQPRRLNRRLNRRKIGRLALLYAIVRDDWHQ